jgi:hypothetical protein
VYCPGGLGSLCGRRDGFGGCDGWDFRRCNSAGCESQLRRALCVRGSRAARLLGELLSQRVGESAFDALNASLYGLPGCGCDEDVQVFWHDCETVEQIAGLFAVVEKGLDEEFCVDGAG